MCLMAPARVLRVEPDACEVATGQRVERISTLFADTSELATGDWVLVLGGNLVRRLDASQAAAMQAALAIASDTPSSAFETPPDQEVI